MRDCTLFTPYYANTPRLDKYRMTLSMTGHHRCSRFWKCGSRDSTKAFPLVILVVAITILYGTVKNTKKDDKWQDNGIDEKQRGGGRRKNSFVACFRYETLHCSHMLIEAPPTPGRSLDSFPSLQKTSLQILFPFCSAV